VVLDSHESRSGKLGSGEVIQLWQEPPGDGRARYGAKAVVEDVLYLCIVAARH